MGYEDLHEADINELLDLIELVGSCISRTSQVILQQSFAAFVKAVKLVLTNLCIKYVLNSKEAKGEPEESSFTNAINLGLGNLPLFLLLVEIELFDISHPNFFKIVD